jgi:hypothetical protein
LKFLFKINKLIIKVKGSCDLKFFWVLGIFSEFLLTSNNYLYRIFFSQLILKIILINFFFQINNLKKLRFILILRESIYGKFKNRILLEKILKLYFLID